MEEYINGLMSIDEDIDVKLFVALSKAVDDEVFTKELLESALDREYNQRLDWLYSLLPSQKAKADSEARMRKMWDGDE